MRILRGRACRELPAHRTTVIDENSARIYEETGIEVEVDQLPYLKMERQTLELAQEDGEYDLIAYVVFSKADYVYAIS